MEIEIVTLAEVEEEGMTLEEQATKVNGAMMVIYEDPQYPEGFIFPAKRLENAKEIPRVLRDFNDRRGGSDYRPQIGFTRDVPGRASLDGSAHRFVQHNVRADNRSYGIALATAVGAVLTQMEIEIVTLAEVEEEGMTLEEQATKAPRGGGYRGDFPRGRGGGYSGQGGQRPWR
ncbi:hypothetical protein TELCIR_00861 [Teladorsagia circumcincta]|uniref:Uncharacterized protein n=1 Tax=Teladorsagia circumcincta TaxID=45464 RepID=A0A2G9V3F9_TELCI|nr:hypothetical protein TELCIR_00861 [Teladorsagia circumcincta]